MTKKHFIALAAEIKRKFSLDRPWLDVDEACRMAAIDAADIICKVAYEFNPRFDETRFRRACGVPE